MAVVLEIEYVPVCYRGTLFKKLRSIEYAVKFPDHHHDRIINQSKNYISSLPVAHTQ